MSLNAQNPVSSPVLVSDAEIMAGCSNSFSRSVPDCDALFPILMHKIGMRGKHEGRGSLFSYVDLERRTRPYHSLQVIRDVVNVAVREISPGFDALYPHSWCV